MSEQLKRTSILRKFYATLALLYLVSIIASWPIIYYLTQQNIQKTAEQELTLLVDMVKSVRTFIGKDLRPYFLPKKIIFAPAISSTVATKHVSKYFKEHQPDYYIKISSDNPLNEDNIPQEFEQKLLDRYRENRELKKLVEVGEINGKPYLVSSKPEIVKSRNCLICHGNPNKAPIEITKEYGKNSGFHWEMDTVAGVSAVGVPLANVNKIALNRSLIASGILTLLFALVFLTITLIVRRHMLLPIIEVTNAAKAVSRGDLTRTIDNNRTDEIGDLNNAFELMRRSLLVLIKRQKKKNK